MPMEVQTLFSCLAEKGRVVGLLLLVLLLLVIVSHLTARVDTPFTGFNRWESCPPDA